jgi:NAD(P)-dependent dehydrogenase (short-subunit alcohol dehydrogenase family)
VCSDLSKSARPEGFETDLHIDTDQLIRDKGGEAIFVKADVSRYSDMEALVKTTVECFGRVDIMVNNAGVAVELKTIVEETEVIPAPVERSSISLPLAAWWAWPRRRLIARPRARSTT